MSENKIPRHLLPQIPGDGIPEFVRFMKENGVGHELVMVPVKDLKAIQAHVNREKVEHFKKDPNLGKQPLLISQGGWILDGHHRWLAQKELDPNSEILCIRFECPINTLVAKGHLFGPSFTKTVYETTTYSRKLWQEKHDPEPENTELLVRKTLRPY